MTEYTFKQLINVNQVRQLLESHQKLSGMAYGLFDTDGNDIVSVGWQDICARFHRVHPVSSARCRESDARIKEHLQDIAKDFVEYRCANGMIDVAIPIIIDGRHLATFLTGQFFYDSDPPQKEFFIAQAHEFSFDRDEYIGALERVPVFSREHIRDNLLFLHKMVLVMAEMGLGNLNSVREMEKHRQIEHHLTLRNFALDHVREAAYLIDKQHRFHYVNDEACRALGYSRDELLHLGVADIDPDFSAEHWPEQRRQVKQHNSLFFETRHKTRAGHVFPVEISAKKFKVDGQEYNLALARDITERTRAEEEIRALNASLEMRVSQRTRELVESETRFRTLADSGQTLVWTCDTENLRNYFNEPWLLFTGRTLEQELGNGWTEGVHPEDLDDYQQTLVMAFDKRERFSVEYRHRHACGPYRWLQDVGAPRVDAKGNFTGYIGHCQDITERVTAESHRRTLFVAVEQSSSSIIITDPEGNIEYVNPTFTKMTGYSRKEIIGQNIRIMRSGELSSETYRNLWQTILSGQIWNGELHSRKKSGEMFWEHVKISPVFDPKGAITRYMAIYDDITDLKIAEEEKKVLQAKLIQTDKMASLGLLSAGIAHEINNPNNYIGINAELLTKTWQSAVPLLDEYYTEHGDFNLGIFRYSETHAIIPQLFSDLVAGSQRIGNIIKKMKNFTRQNIEGYYLQVDINSVVMDALSILNHEIKNYCNNIELEAGKDLPTVLCDAQQISQVLINLIMNSLQSLPDKNHGLKISTKLNDAGDRVCIVVKDQGRGMTPEVLEQITEPFFTTKAARGGTGLGLYVSMNILKQNSGSLSFASEPGKGTIATICLPVNTANNPIESVTAPA